jgi:hypothetical protein
VFCNLAKKTKRVLDGIQQLQAQQRRETDYNDMKQDKIHQFEAGGLDWTLEDLSDVDHAFKTTPKVPIMTKKALRETHIDNYHTVALDVNFDNVNIDQFAEISDNVRSKGPKHSAQKHVAHMNADIQIFGMPPDPSSALRPIGSTRKGTKGVF